MPKRTRDYNSWRLEKLADPQIAEAYLNDALRDDSPQMFLRALLNVTQAQQNVAAVATKAGIKRETIYRAFSRKGNPTLDTLNSVLAALGLRIQVAARTKVAVHSPGTPAPRTGVYRAQKRSSRRKSVFLESTGQARLPFSELTQTQISVYSAGWILEKSQGVNFSVGHKSSVVQPVSEVQIYSRYIALEKQEQVPAVPSDFLGAASAGTINVAHI